MAQFCPSCGHQQENPNNAFCSKCGAPLNNAQQTVNPTMGAVPQESHTGAIIGGYVCSTLLTFLLGIIGVIASIIIGVYLYTRDNEEVHKHGIVIIAVSIVMMIITVFIVGALFG